jgi:HTH-type transcriptional regulator/antitoxin HigA
MVPHSGAARSRLIEVLATLVEKYESRERPNPQLSPAETLAHLLEAGNVQCASLARETGIPAATLSNVLAGRRGVSKENAIRLGRYFGLSPMMFLMEVRSAKRTTDSRRDRKS